MLFPLVENPKQFNHYKEMFTKYRAIRCGAMIETAKGIKNIVELIRLADFISIGTNHLSNTMDEQAVISAIKDIIQICRKSEKTVYVCGRLARHEAVLKIVLQNDNANITISL